MSKQKIAEAAKYSHFRHLRTFHHMNMERLIKKSNHTECYPRMFSWHLLERSRLLQQLRRVWSNLKKKLNFVINQNFRRYSKAGKSLLPNCNNSCGIFLTCSFRIGILVIRIRSTNIGLNFHFQFLTQHRSCSYCCYYFFSSLTEFQGFKDVYTFRFRHFSAVSSLFSKHSHLMVPQLDCSFQCKVSMNWNADNLHYSMRRCSAFYSNVSRHFSKDNCIDENFSLSRKNSRTTDLYE